MSDDEVLENLIAAMKLRPNPELRRVIEQAEAKMPPSPLSGEPGGDEDGG